MRSNNNNIDKRRKPAVPKFNLPTMSLVKTQPVLNQPSMLQQQLPTLPETTTSIAQTQESQTRNTTEEYFNTIVQPSQLQPSLAELTGTLAPLPIQSVIEPPPQPQFQPTTVFPLALQDPSSLTLQDTSALASQDPPIQSSDNQDNTVVKVNDESSVEGSIMSIEKDPTRKFRHYHFKEIDDELDRTFGLDHTNDSTILDIIVVYVKGQKILYTEAKTLCEQRLNALMIPAIFNTAICTILSLVLKDLVFGATIVSVLNGINALFLTLITYLKLDARAEAHRTSAYKFDKLQSFLEFNSGKVLFTTPNKDNKSEYDIYQIMKIAEKEIREIKETNQFILPELVRFKFPILYSTNVFSLVKEYMNEDMQLVNKFKDALNRKQDYKMKLANLDENCDSKEREQLENELANADNTCKEMLNKIIEKKKDYLKIDDSYQQEVDTYIMRMRPGLCDWLKS